MAGNVDKYEQLSAYLDGELSESERAAVERMLVSDAEARSILSELRQTARMIQGLPRERLSTVASAALNARLERESLLGGAAPGTIRPRPLWQSLSIAAAILIVCGVTYQSFVYLQEYREKRVFQLADAEYSKMPGSLQVAPKAMPAAGARPNASSIDSAASPGWNDQVASPLKEPMSLAETRGRDSDPPRGAVAAARNIGGKDESHSAPVFGLFDDREKREEVDAKPADEPVVAAAAEKPASRFDSAFRSPMKAKIATSRPSTTSQPTSRPAVPTTQPSTQGPARE